VSRPLGELTAANLLGGAAGALGAGFVLLPALGIRGALLATIVGYVVLADVVAPRTLRLRPLGWAVLLVAAVLPPTRVPLVRPPDASYVVRAVREGPGGVAAVVDSGRDLKLKLDGSYTLGGSGDARGDRRMGLVPLLLHPAPQRAAFIGVATGITASAAVAAGVPDITVIELVPDVVSLAREHFGTLNAGLLERPDVRIVVDDGRRFLAGTRERFDVIVSDLFIPWHAGTGNLYARETFALAARRLAPGGLFCQWLPLYQLAREEFDVVARTFLEVFPQATLWRAEFYPERPAVGLVGQMTPRPVDLTVLEARLARLPAWVQDPLFASPDGVVLLYAGDLTAAAGLFAGAPLNTDDHPVIEFRAPRHARRAPPGDAGWFVGERLAAFYGDLDARLGARPDPLFPHLATLTDLRRAGTAVVRYALATAAGDDRAGVFEAEVRRLAPRAVAASDAAKLPDATADLRQRLDDLRAEHARSLGKLADLERQLSHLTKPEAGS
jgi:spermidine synthase